MSHGGMSLEQAKEMQKRYGGRVISIGFPEDRRSTWYPNTDEDFGLQADSTVDAVSMAHIVLSRSKEHKGELVPKTLKSRDSNIGLGGFTVQRFER